MIWLCSGCMGPLARTLQTRGPPGAVVGAPLTCSDARSTAAVAMALRMLVTNATDHLPLSALPISPSMRGRRRQRGKCAVSRRAHHEVDARVDARRFQLRR